MTLIKALLQDQVLTLVETPVIASGGVEEDVVSFDFGIAAWDGYIKKAVFYRDESDVYHVDIGSDNTAVIPWEVLQQEGFMFLGVFGTKGSEIKTSTVARYRVEHGAITSATQLDPTPDIFAEIILNTAARHSHGNKTVLDGITAEKVSEWDNSKSAYQYAVEGGYTGTEEEFTEKLSQIGGSDEKNLFSFENADNNIAWLSKNKPDTNYIYAQSSIYGYKDTANNYFVFTGENDRNYGITGGLDNPLPVGSYKLSAEVFIPSGNTSRTIVTFGTWVAPSVYKDSSDFDIGAQDTWTTVEKVFTVSEGDTVNYIYGKSYIDLYPFYVRNIKVISLEPKLEGWEGKKWAAVGDSITEKNGKALKQYHDYIAESTGIAVVNMGVSGTGYKQYENTNNAFYQRILNVPTDVDVVTIFGSGNDLNHTLGNVTDTGTDTLCGCINTTIDNLYSVLPTVQLGIITPTPWGGFNPSDDSNIMAQYSAKIVEICRLRGIPCLDLYHCSGMRPWDDTFCSHAYNMNAAGDNYDRVHPNKVGHSIFAPRIKAFLQSLII